MIVFGQSDMNDQFHLVCLGVSSHETELDFRKFYQTLMDICFLCDIKFEPSFVVQNGCIASYNGREVVKYNLPILMCYFHVIKNVKEN